MTEKNFFNKYYNMRPKRHGNWLAYAYPERQEVLSIMGDISNKRILCLGNGNSTKELSLQCKELIISDISERSFMGLIPSPNTRLEVFDALSIPYRDSYFDIVYGWQFTHHIADLNKLLKEVYRVLSPGGIVVFVDNVHSPVWQFIKWKLLKRLTLFFLNKRGISDRDLQFTLSGDYRENTLKKLVLNAGFGEFKSKRFNLLSYILSKLIRDSFGSEASESGVFYIIICILSFVDRLFCVFSFYSNNLRNLVWSAYKDGLD